MKNRFTGIRARLLVIIALTLVPTVALFGWYAARQNALAERRIEGDLRRLAVNNGRLVDGLLERGHATLSALALDPAFQEGRWPEVQRVVEQVAAEHREYLNVGVLRRDGLLMASALPFEPGISAGDRAYFRRTIKYDAFSIGDYQVSLVAKRPSFNVGYPVKRDETITAVAYLSFDIGTLRRELREPRAPEGTVQVLMDGNGRVLLREPRLKGAEGRLFPERRKALSLARNGGIAEFPGADGITRRYMFTTVHSQPEGVLYLGVGYEPAAVFAPDRAARNSVLAGLAALTLISMAVGWLVATRWVYRPAARLTEAAQRLAEGDLAARAALGHGPDELGELGVRFDAMAGAMEKRVRELREAREELAVLNVDLEERVRRRTAELEAANKELEAFSYSVSHDLRAPLRTIDGFSQALEEDYGDRLDEQAHDYLGRVRAAARKMSDLIDAMLTLSRLTRTELRVQTVDLTEMADSIAEELRERDHTHEVRFSVQPGLRANGDPALLRVLLVNLLDNAWKYTHKCDEARVEFGAAERDGEMVYFVRDNGVGFDMTYSGKLFAAFQRLHRQDEYAGIGIGLTTAARVVHRHGGRIWAEAEPNMGATFYFTLC